MVNTSIHSLLTLPNVIRAFIRAEDYVEKVPAMDAENERLLAVGARRVLASKLALQKAFPTGYVNDPTVAILFSLFIDHLEGVASTDRSVCSVVDYVSTSIVERWLTVLKADGFITIGCGTRVGRIIGLTESGVDLVKLTLIAIGNAEKRERDDAAIRGISTKAARYS